MPGHHIEDQFERYVVQMFGPNHPITKDDMKVMRQFWFAGYRCCYHTVQHASALPTEEAVQAVMNVMLKDLQEFFPGSSQLVENPLGPPEPVLPRESVIKGPLGVVGPDGQVKPFDASQN